MAGIPTVVNTVGQKVVDSLALGRSSGTTAQNWAGLVMSENDSSLENSSAVVAPGEPNPQDQYTVVVDGSPVQVGRAGYLAPGQPGGQNADALVPGGQYDTDNQVQTIGSPAGTAGGGGQYPGAASNPVADPMMAPGWTVQGSNTGDDYEQMIITTASPIDETHGDAFSVTLAATGGDGSNTWSVESGSLPTDVTLSTGGALAGTTGTTAGTSTFEVKVVDSHGNTAQKIFELVLS